jgi:hypothetical protein
MRSTFQWAASSAEPFGVDAVFAGLLREEQHEQLVIGAKMFGGMIAAALVLGWLMRPFPI